MSSSSFGSGKKRKRSKSAVEEATAAAAAPVSAEEAAAAAEAKKAAAAAAAEAAREKKRGAALAYLQAWRMRETAPWRFSKTLQQWWLASWGSPAAVAKADFAVFVDYAPTIAGAVSFASDVMVAPMRRMMPVGMVPFSCR